MKKPAWWPRNPYPRSLFTLSADEYQRVIPDPLTRSRVAGMLGRVFWEIASDAILNAMKAAEAEKADGGI